MTDRASIQTLLDELYAARISGDVERIMRCFNPGARVEQAGSPEACFAACAVEGAPNVRGMIQAMVDGWDFVSHTPFSTLIEGNRAALHTRLSLRHRPTGQAVETDVAHFWTFDGDKVVSFTEFADTAAINMFAQRAAA